MKIRLPNMKIRLPKQLGPKPQHIMGQVFGGSTVYPVFRRRRKGKGRRTLAGLKIYFHGFR